MSFGTNVGVIDANIDQTTTIKVTCTKGTPFQVALGARLNGTSAVKVTCSNGTPWTASLALGPGETATARTMTKGTANITYGLYKDTARTAPWSTGTQAATGTGNGSVQSIPVYARIPVVTGAQPSAGEYSDTVILAY